MLGTIAALAVVVSRSVSGAALEVSASQLTARRESDLSAGVELGALAVLRTGKAMRSAEASVALPGRRIHVRVTNERARIDLNTATPALLSSLLKANGVIDADAVAMSQSVVEWRGGSASQQLAALKGDEGQFTGFARPAGIDPHPDAEFRKAPERMVGTRFFFHPMQLASVPGFSKSLVTKLLPLVTVANGAGQLDPYIASPGVLLALPGVSPATVDAFLNARDGNSGRELALKLLGVADALVTSTASPGWRIEITSVGHEGRIRRGEAVIAVLDGDSEPYRVLYVLADHWKAD
jgi:general secretion pathway protein K